MSDLGHNEAGKQTMKEKDYFQLVNNGEMLPSEVREEAPEIYTKIGNLTRFEKLRDDYLMKCEPPASVKNIYLSGAGGTGKSVLARAIARALYPEVEVPSFTVGGDGVSWEGYDGEPVIIWEDMEVSEMLKAAGSRGKLYRILGPHRDKGEKAVVKVKYSKKSLLNAYNIIIGMVSPQVFLDGLSGKYEEYKEQAYRSIPLVVGVYEDSYQVHINKGVYNGTREFLEYADAGAYRQQLGQVMMELNGIEDLDRRDRVQRQLEGATVRPILDLLDLIATR